MSEEFVKPYFDHILNKESVNEFCMRYNGGDIPEEKELRQILEKKLNPKIWKEMPLQPRNSIAQGKQTSF